MAILLEVIISDLKSEKRRIPVSADKEIIRLVQQMYLNLSKKSCPRK
jgi:hypothetical protein